MNGGDKPIQVIIHTYMEDLNETPCIDILNKQKSLFFEMENRKVKQFLSGSWYQGQGGEQI
jgi:hypothetical protein